MKEAGRDKRKNAAKEILSRIDKNIEDAQRMRRCVQRVADIGIPFCLSGLEKEFGLDYGVGVLADIKEISEWMKRDRAVVNEIGVDFFADLLKEQREDVRKNYTNVRVISSKTSEGGE